MSHTVGQRIVRALVVVLVAMAVIAVLYALVLIVLVSAGVWGGA